MDLRFTEGDLVFITDAHAARAAGSPFKEAHESKEVVTINKVNSPQAAFHYIVGYHGSTSSFDDHELGPASKDHQFIQSLYAQ